jgi:lysophospholipase L1-like esterase
MKVLCIGDSLALPGHLNRYEDTWFYKVKKEFKDIDFISFFKRQLTTDVLCTMGGGENGIDKWPKGGDLLEAYIPDKVIIQLGIVDCAPRLLYKYEKIIVSKLPNILAKNYLRFVKLVRQRSVVRTDVPLNKFKKNIEAYIERAHKLKVEQIIFIGICIPDSNLIQKNTHILILIEQYNRILLNFEKQFQFVKCIFPLDSNKQDLIIYQDGYHPNMLGHQLIFEKIKNFLN